MGAPVWLVLLAQLVLTVPLVWRRRFPLVVTAVVADALAAHRLLPIGWLQGDVAAPVALYSVAVRRPDTPDRAEEAVQKMATTGRQALRELRQTAGTAPDRRAGAVRAASGAGRV